MRPQILSILLAAPLSVAAAGPLSLEDAIRAAWSANEGFAASGREADAARLDAEAARDRRLPTLELHARAVRTGEPMAVFGMRLDQGRVSGADFDPARLNDPDPLNGYAAGATLTQVLYAGGRITAGRRAAAAQAESAAAAHDRRRDELAAAVVEAYFGAQAAAQALRWAEDVLAHARETERFVAARRADGAALASELARATAFRAQAEADVAQARQREASARSGLALLAGPDAAGAELTTSLDAPAAPLPDAAAPPAGRPDLVAARARADAAREAGGAARGALLPEVFAQGSLETMRSGLRDGEAWYAVVLGARWTLGVEEVRAARAAAAREDGERSCSRWK
jgi:outer membrane protein TolC